MKRAIASLGPSLSALSLPITATGAVEVVSPAPFNCIGVGERAVASHRADVCVVLLEALIEMGDFAEQMGRSRWRSRADPRGDCVPRIDRRSLERQHDAELAHQAADAVDGRSARLDEPLAGAVHEQP